MVRPRSLGAGSVKNIPYVVWWWLLLGMVVIVDVDNDGLMIMHYATYPSRFSMEQYNALQWTRWNSAFHFANRSFHTEMPLNENMIGTAMAS